MAVKWLAPNWLTTASLRMDHVQAAIALTEQQIADSKRARHFAARHFSGAAGVHGMRRLNCTSRHFPGCAMSGEGCWHGGLGARELGRLSIARQSLEADGRRSGSRSS